MSPDTEAAIIANDLDSLMRRIEALPPHPRYTAAVVAAQEAHRSVQAGRLDLHQRALRERHGDLPPGVLDYGLNDGARHRRGSAGYVPPAFRRNGG